jgi:hypothetical protein
MMADESPLRVEHFRRLCDRQNIELIKVLPDSDVTRKLCIKAVETTVEGDMTTEDRLNLTPAMVHGYLMFIREKEPA